MAQWKEIYSNVRRYECGPETSYMCKVPSNSLFYNRTDVVSQVADMMLTYPRKRDKFSYYTADYKNTAVSENLSYTFDGQFGEIIALKDAGKIDIKFEVLKKEKMVNMLLVTRTYCTKLNDYLMEHLGDKTKKTVYVSEFIENDCELMRNYVKTVCTEIDTLTIQYYNKYLNSNMEFDIEYMDNIASTKEHLSQCGLVFVVEEHETKGRHVIIRASKIDYVNIYTEPCTLEGGNGSLVDLMKFLGIDFNIEKQTKTFKSYEDMFEFINTFADLYKLYKNSFDTTFSGIFDCFVKPVEAA